MASLQHFSLFKRITNLTWDDGDLQEFFGLYLARLNRLESSSERLFTQMSERPLSPSERSLLAKATAPLSLGELDRHLRELPVEKRERFARTVLTAEKAGAGKPA